MHEVFRLVSRKINIEYYTFHVSVPVRRQRTRLSPWAKCVTRVREIKQTFLYWLSFFLLVVPVDWWKETTYMLKPFSKYQLRQIACNNLTAFIGASWIWFLLWASWPEGMVIRSTEWAENISRSGLITHLWWYSMKDPSACASLIITLHSNVWTILTLKYGKPTFVQTTISHKLSSMNQVNLGTGYQDLIA